MFGPVKQKEAWDLTFLRMSFLMDLFLYMYDCFCKEMGMEIMKFI
jgi:hypothetical protein